MNADGEGVCSAKPFCQAAATGMPPDRFGAGTLGCDYMDDRLFDFNRDWLARYGMVRDQLQGVRNVGVPAADFRALFESA